MKISKYLVGALLAGVLLLTCGFGGCSSAANQKPPSALEMRVFDVQTNITPVVQIIYQTNLVQMTNTVNLTNVQTGVAWTTNVATVVPQVQTYTNIIQQTNYILTPSSQAKSDIQVGGALSNIAMPGSGTLATAVLTGLLGIWGSLRSKRATKLQDVADSAHQVIETARSIIQASPNGDAIGAKFDTFMMKHQIDAGVASDVAKMIDKTVSPKEADGVASQILGEALAPLGTPKTAVTTSVLTSKV